MIAVLISPQIGAYYIASFPRNATLPIICMATVSVAVLPQVLSSTVVHSRCPYGSWVLMVLTFIGVIQSVDCSLGILGICAWESVIACLVLVTSKVGKPQL